MLESSRVLLVDGKALSEGLVELVAGERGLGVELVELLV